MAEKLSQTEIDALLGSSADPLAAADPGYTTSEDVQLYDFRRPRHVSKERLRTLEAMYERLTKSLEAWLIGRVRRQVELKLQSVEQFTFGECADSSRFGFCNRFGISAATTKSNDLAGDACGGSFNNFSGPTCTFNFLTAHSCFRSRNAFDLRPHQCKLYLYG